ncbi:MAG: ASPIC/UnbV domain-containing protein, partial [Terriglobia bacterium]
VSSGGSFGASPLAQHIGLGKSSGALQLEIHWPASKTRQIFSGIGPNQFLQVTEFAKHYEVLTPKTFEFGRKKRP